MPSETAELAYIDKWYVSRQGNDSSNGQTLQTPFRTIQKAIDAANNNDTIMIASGNYIESGGLTIHDKSYLKIAGIQTFPQVAAGRYHNLFIKSDGSRWGMGENGNGQLGDGSTTDRHSPVQVGI